MWKDRIVSFVIGLALGILGTAGVILAGQFGGPGELAGLDRANQQRTAETVTNLERTTGEQRERIIDLEQANLNLRTSNNRLEEHIGDARRISQQLTISVGTETADIRSAIELLKTITDQVKDLDRVLDSGDTGGGGSGGMGGVDAGGEITETR